MIQFKSQIGLGSLHDEIEIFCYILNLLLHTNSCNILDKNLAHKTYISKKHKREIYVLGTRHWRELWND